MVRPAFRPPPGQAHRPGPREGAWAHGRGKPARGARERVMRIKRAAQGISLGLFVLAVWALARDSGMSGPGAALARFYSRFDPVLVFGADIAARAVAASLWLAGVVTLSGLVFGRAFCGNICPMGATLDAAGRLVGREKRRPPANPVERAGQSRSAGPRRLKYLVLAAVLASALAGVSLVFWVSPLSLATRFYGLFVLPAAELAANGFLRAADPLLEALSLIGLKYASVPGHRFAGQLFIVAFFGTLFILARREPRFWCRYLCPAGAILALFSGRPRLVARRVGEGCTGCGACRRACPMGAIPVDPKTTIFSECIVCRACLGACPEKAISFTPFTGPGTPPAAAHEPVSPSRREFLAAGAVGLGAAVTGLTGLREGVWGDDAGGRPLSPAAVRPPGAVPEPDFLARCVRCGACMRVCPTNMLQPDVFSTGWTGLFAPLAMARRGGCQPDCTACGAVCPTGAIRELAGEEKMWARMGTAHVLRHKCLAWEFDKKCLVCDEVCPYNALQFLMIEGHSVAVPFVLEDKCTGCGWCERHCPVTAKPAIVVEPMGAARLAAGSYREAGQAAGLRIERRPAGPYRDPTQAPSGQGPNDLPPGFSP
ncbi:4Fe-4S binding protein [Desulfolutivibrio sulfoxidireducens]|nr:4Fe-4S binding protein [Desulfolutivibrio sulfoxidireducens]